MWLHWIITSHGSCFHQLWFYANWVISPASLVKSCSLWEYKPSTENTICFSLWDREKLVCCCNCFGASLSKKSGREQRRGMKGEVFFLFSLFFYLFCSLSLQLSHKNSIGSSYSLSKNLSQMKRLSRLWYRNCLHHSPSSACASSGGKTNSL